MLSYIFLWHTMESRPWDNFPTYSWVAPDLWSFSRSKGMDDQFPNCWKWTWPMQAWHLGPGIPALDPTWSTFTWIIMETLSITFMCIGGTLNEQLAQNYPPTLGILDPWKITYHQCDLKQLHQIYQKQISIRAWFQYVIYGIVILLVNS